MKFLKDSPGSVPSTEVTWKLAKVLGVGVDILLEGDFSQASDNLQYLARYFAKLKYQTDANQLEWEKRTIAEIESPTAVYLGIMKLNGVPVDRDLMEERKQEADREMQRIRAEIADIIGPVNNGSNASTNEFKQYLFRDLGLPVLKTTDTNREAADDATMIMLKEWCDQNKPELSHLFELVQEYRKWNKISSTYIGDYDMLMTGDSLKQAELNLLEKHSLPDTELLIVGHHGSRTSTDDLFLETIRAEDAVISVGNNNSYGHPNREVLIRLQTHGCNIWRTDRNGTVEIRVKHA